MIENDCQPGFPGYLAYPSTVLVVIRFRIPVAVADPFRGDLERLHALLRDRPGYVEGFVGRNADDPELWLLSTQWESVGAYRRAVGWYDVRVVAVPLLGRAVDEPSAYEIVMPGAPLNEAGARGT